MGGAAVFTALTALTGLSHDALHERAVALGDLGDLAGELFAERSPSGITVTGIADAFAQIAATTGTAARRTRVRELLAPLGPDEARFATKLLLGAGSLRIGLKEAQVEEALARAFGRPLQTVRHANLLRGDVGEVAVAAREGTLEAATLALFHPIGFMLAQPLATAEEIAATLAAPFAVEDKYDGIRAQAHVAGGRVALFSRTLDDITAGYPEVVAALQVLAERLTSPRQDGDTDELLDGLVLDGELIAHDPADPERPLPFLALQRRLRRKAPGAELLGEVPVQFVAYDLLACGGRLVVERPYAWRRARLAALPWPEHGARVAPVVEVGSAAEVEGAFERARAAGNEGIIAKDRSAPYTPGRRGKAWVKLKKALATLDVVIVGAERGHGRRAKVLSDYTFAVRAAEDDPRLLTVGKAYTGLTDAEIAALSERLEASTIQRFGRFHQVRPEIVLEVTFDIVQASARHKSGFALRFPRIVRIRDDKPPSEADTLDAVRRLAAP